VLAETVIPVVLDAVLFIFAKTQLDPPLSALPALVSLVRNPCPVLLA
jgi:hypothetical protein